MNSSTDCILTAFVVEPNTLLVKPYLFIPKTYKVFRFSNIKTALRNMASKNPDLVIISASIDPNDALILLEAIKQMCNYDIISIIIVVDLGNPINFVPGVKWGGKIGIIDTNANLREFLCILSRL